MGSAKNSNRFMLFQLYYQIVVILVLGFAVVIAAAYIPGLSFETISIGALTVAQEVIMFIFPCILVALLYRNNLKEIFPFKRIGIENILLIAVMCVLIQPFLMLLSSISSVFSENIVSDSLDSIFDEGGIFLMLSALAVTPAVCEELAMRGVALSGYKNVPIVKAAVINGLFFGFMHLNPQQFLYTFVIGAVFACFVRYTGSLSSSILGHFIINGVQVSWYYLAKMIPEEIMDAAAEQAEETSIVGALILLAVISAVLMPIFIILFNLFIKHNEKRNKPAGEAGYHNEDHNNEDEETSDLIEPEAATPKKPERVFTLSFLGVIIIYVIYVAAEALLSNISA